MPEYMNTMQYKVVVTDSETDPTTCVVPWESVLTARWIQKNSTGGMNVTNRSTYDVRDRTECM